MRPQRRVMSFDHGGAMTREIPQARELAVRESNGIHVLLLWHPDEDAVTVTVEDASATTKRLLPAGTRARLLPEPANRPR